MVRIDSGRANNNDMKVLLAMVIGSLGQGLGEVHR